MTGEQKEYFYDLLNKAECLYTGKVLGDFSIQHFVSDVEPGTVVKEQPLVQMPPAVPPQIIRTAPPASVPQPDNTQDIQQQLASIAQKIAACQRCQLCANRTNTVPGIGVPRPLVMVIGEAPGHDEDVRGEPFVGAAGQLLDKMLASIQLSRHDNCFIANIVKCRPHGNRDPLPEEAAACASFLQAQIHILQPRSILTVGRIAVQNLLNTSTGINRLRGQFYEYNGIPLLPTYHPSALLRNEDLKRPAWEDLKLFRTKLLQLDPNYQQKYLNGGN